MAFIRKEISFENTILYFTWETKMKSIYRYAYKYCLDNDLRVYDHVQVGSDRILFVVLEPIPDY